MAFLFSFSFSEIIEAHMWPTVKQFETSIQFEEIEPDKGYMPQSQMHIIYSHAVMIFLTSNY